MNISFDLISDLNLTAADTFDWDGKPTSLYCLVAGNTSSDIIVLAKTLAHLATMYHGVFFIDGSLEHNNLEKKHKRVDEFNKLCKNLKNVVYLHNNVVIVDGIALAGVNGWYANYSPKDSMDEIRYEMSYHEDMSYLCSTIEKLQLHNDVKKIVVMSNCVPSKELFFGESPENIDSLGPAMSLIHDTEGKVSHWVFGTYGKIVDTVIGNINYLNNCPEKNQPYWAKRFEVSY